MINGIFVELRHKVDEEVQNITRDLRVVIAVGGEVAEAERDPVLAQRVRTGVPDL
ncbi:hypothetical protein BDV12DRAFT_160342 [Aspergillus spectabilis]